MYKGEYDAQSKKSHPYLTTLPNCVGYFIGRFHEIANDPTFSIIKMDNAERLIAKNPHLKVGMTPKVGAGIVWQKGPTLQGSDGAGHVEIVEQVISETEIVTSWSGWHTQTDFGIRNRKKLNGNWGAGSDYKFLGFIYNPACEDEPQNIKVLYLGQDYTVRSIIKDNENYIKMKDLEDVLHLCGVGWMQNKVILNGKPFDTKKYHVILKDDENYLRVRDLQDMGIANVTWNQSINRVVIMSNEDFK